MRLFTDKRKNLFFYLFIFFFLTTTNNKNLNFFNNFGKINKMRINDISDNFREDLYSKLLFVKKENIFFIDKDILKKKMESLNYVENYEIKKIYPSTILINVTLVDLIAEILLNEKKYFIASNGKLLNTELFVNDSNTLPKFYGSYSEKKFLKLLKKLKNSNIKINEVKAFYIFKSERWDLQMENILIKLPKKNLDKALRNSKNIISKLPKGQKSIVDLRIENKVIISNE